jgi:hypothetical protein
MASKKHRPEEALAKLRQVDVLVSQGQSVAEAIRAIGVTEVTYYLYGLLPLRKRSSGWDLLASLRTCIRRLGFDPSARMANPPARASTAGRPTRGRDRSQALRASV